MPNLAKLTDLDAFKRAWRTVFKLKDYRTPSEVVLSIRVPGI